jgi:hypothetical protein
MGERQQAFHLTGFSNNNAMENITFDNCTVGGKKINGIGDAIFTINPFVKDIKFL